MYRMYLSLITKVLNELFETGTFPILPSTPGPVSTETKDAAVNSLVDKQTNRQTDKSPATRRLTGFVDLWSRGRREL